MAETKAIITFKMLPLMMKRQWGQEMRAYYVERAQGEEKGEMV